MLSSTNVRGKEGLMEGKKKGETFERRGERERERGTGESWEGTEHVKEARIP